LAVAHSGSMEEPRIVCVYEETRMREQALVIGASGARRPGGGR
jgi:hypothetical protein